MTKVPILDKGLPLSYLKGRRRDIIAAWATIDTPPTAAQLQEVATLQQVIAAVEAVIADDDIDDYRPENFRPVGKDGFPEERK